MKQYILFRLITLFTLALSTVTGLALDLSHYASESVLSEGRWVKISVDESGMHRIPAATLRKWGFSDPAAVRIYGYGGQRIADALTEQNYIDDLPLVKSVTSSDGSVVFYAVGPHTWEGDNMSVRRSNPYSTKGYYFVTENSEEIPALPKTGTPGANDPVTTFTERLQHEQDLVSPGECGQLLVGEDFRYTPTRRFNFDLPGICGPLTFRTSFIAKTYNSASKLTFSANGTQLPQIASDAIAATTKSGEFHGVEGKTTHTIDNPGNKLELTITHSASTIIYNAWLNYIAVNYERELTLPSSSPLSFTTSDRALSLGNASKWVSIWDVTEPAKIKEVDFAIEGNNAVWTASSAGSRDYCAWAESANMPAPELVGTISNQNLHAEGAADMIIFTHPAWRSQAERIAELHRGAPDNMTVRVVDAEEVYNEFSSGASDVSGLRKYMKMVYDRGAAEGSPLRYVLLMGRMTYDERHLTSGVRDLGAMTLPAWQQRDDWQSLDPEEGFATDDFIAMLEDGSGSRLGYDKLSVAVGRIPVTSASTAKSITDKIIDYVRRSQPGAWKNRIMALADDLDGGVHYKQTEWFMNGVDQNENSPFILEKVYLPAFEKSNGVYQSARDKMFRTLNDGVAWWTFVGHASNHSWTSDGMLTYTDINSMYLRHLPFLYAATCNFLRWDSNTESGGEIMMYENNGGVIGMISATRPVYITYNGYFTNAIGKEVSRRDDEGRLLTLGEIYRRAKNNIRSINDSGKEGEIINNENRLRYVFMGDPALRLATPDNIVTIESVDGIAAGGAEQIILPARGRVTIKGSVTDAEGNSLPDFNGTLLLDLYDADRSTVLEGSEYETMRPFDEHGEKLYSGSCRVVGGQFELSVSMPAEISDNFREATISMAAYSDDGLTEASGLNHSCYVYGFDEDAADDKEPPVIEMLALNHPTFRSGDEVNADPILIASVNDNVGINLSMSGIGHQMSVMLDEKRSFNDVPYYYTPASDGSPAGEIAYPLEGLTEGHHTISFRVFDTNGNSATKTIDCFVREGLAPTVFDVYSDVNPATTEANFYLSHNRPESMLTVTISVYNLLGHKLWSQTSTGRSDMYLSAPVTWDLTDGTGRRVPRGIYVYSATVTADGENYTTASRKIAVTSR
ncbi:MAG: type IX secretion system sortase PorU [Muribaculaceae bacterium]|nr:type IX secretion system sortase PorU [Muribaculaceae bacterium]